MAQGMAQHMGRHTGHTVAPELCFSFDLLLLLYLYMPLPLAFICARPCCPCCGTRHTSNVIVIIFPKETDARKKKKQKRKKPYLLHGVFLFDKGRRSGRIEDRGSRDRLRDFGFFHFRHFLRRSVFGGPLVLGVLHFDRDRVFRIPVPLVFPGPGLTAVVRVVLPVNVVTVLRRRPVAKRRHQIVQPLRRLLEPGRRVRVVPRERRLPQRQLLLVNGFHVPVRLSVLGVLPGLARVLVRVNGLARRRSAKGIVHTVLQGKKKPRLMDRVRRKTK